MYFFIGSAVLLGLQPTLYQSDMSRILLFLCVPNQPIPFLKLIHVSEVRTAYKMLRLVFRKIDSKAE